MASNPCSACKVLKSVCTGECVFAPYYPSTEPEKFALSYEAEDRIQDPVTGCVGMSLAYEKILNNLKTQIVSAKNEIVATMGSDKVPEYNDIPMPEDFLMTQNQQMGDNHGANEASTSATPPASSGGTNDTQQTP
ncbi:LOB domain-containing protein 32 [Eutrema salsugineum]|uniref:LOB domain-containing protein 32 n=1 Tax=Eutrema salsugineum TaxID=72664 RepID=UPI000CED0E11|nr:LOB domain-containing protein 32 [Eutrema salsugineum]